MSSYLGRWSQWWGRWSRGTGGPTSIWWRASDSSQTRWVNELLPGGGDPSDGAGDRGGLEVLPVSGGEHQTVPKPGELMSCYLGRWSQWWGRRLEVLPVSSGEHQTVPKPGELMSCYLVEVIPVMGQVIAGDWRSYQYLVESIRQFPNQVS